MQITEVLLFSKNCQKVFLIWWHAEYIYELGGKPIDEMVSFPELKSTSLIH